MSGTGGLLIPFDITIDFDDETFGITEFTSAITCLTSEQQTLRSVNKLAQQSKSREPD